jgi:hypothetical protein
MSGIIFDSKSVLPNGTLINGVANFYTGTKPTTRVDGSALVSGDLWFNPSTGAQGFWNNTYWLSSNLYKCTAINVLVSVGGSTSGWGADFPDAASQIFVTTQWLNCRFIPAISGDKWGVQMSFRNGSDGTPLGLLPLVEAVSPNITTYTYKVAATLNTFYDLPANSVNIVAISITKTGSSSNFSGSAGFNYRIVL